MKMCLNILLVICLFLFITSVSAAELSRIELSDGSVITGRVISFDGTVWIIESGSMGRLKLESSKVVSIRSQPSADQRSSNVPSGEKQLGKDDIQAMQQNILANEQLMTLIMNLHSDPEIQAILTDPEIMNAVNTGDIGTLMANPKFIKLLEKAEIKAITEEVIK
jgi:hypothetical protein